MPCAVIGAFILHNQGGDDYGLASWQNAIFMMSDDRFLVLTTLERSVINSEAEHIYVVFLCEKTAWVIHIEENWRMLAIFMGLEI
jgi:hypothetical protein